MVYQRYKNTERKKMYHDGRRRKTGEYIQYLRSLPRCFFIAGIITEFYLKKTDMHVSDYLGNFI